MLRQTSKSIDSWASLLAKELAPAPKPKGGKMLVDIQAMRKKANLPCGGSVTSAWISEQIGLGTLEKVTVFERDGGGKKKRRVYYVPAK